MVSLVRRWWRAGATSLIRPARFPFAPALEVVGMALIVAGLWLWSVPVALIVAGGLCIFLAQGEVA